MAVQHFNTIDATAITSSPNGKYVLARDYDALLQQNVQMRKAIEFAIAPDLWTLICVDERAWRYKRGAQKYQEVLRNALEFTGDKEI